eukprot:77940_1
MSPTNTSMSPTTKNLVDQSTIHYHNLSMSVTPDANTSFATINNCGLNWTIYLCTLDNVNDILILFIYMSPENVYAFEIRLNGDYCIPPALCTVIVNCDIQCLDEINTNQMKSYP